MAVSHKRMKNPAHFIYDIAIRESKDTQQAIRKLLKMQDQYHELEDTWIELETVPGSENDPDPYDQMTPKEQDQYNWSIVESYEKALEEENKRQEQQEIDNAEDAGGSI